MRTAAVLAVFVVLAAVSFSFALSMATAGRSPLFAADLFPPNGLAKGEASARLAGTAVTQNGEGLPSQLAAEADQLAREGLALEPLSTEAIRALGLIRVLEGDTDRAALLMRHLASLTKRDRVANIWLIEDYARRGRFAESLDHLDLALRGSRASESLLLPRLVETLGYPETIPVFEQLLLRQPPWATSFWLALVKNDAALLNGAQLRARLAAAGVEGEETTDAVLIAGLIRQGAYSEAVAFGRQLSPNRSASSDPVAGSDFDVLPVYPPLDWALTSEGDYGAEIVPDAGQLLMSALPDAGGVVARQFLRLEPGTYRPKVELASQPLPDTRAEVSLACASGLKPGTQVFEQQLGTGEALPTFGVTNGGCSHFWLELSIHVPPGGEADDVLLNRVSLERET